MLLWWLYYNYMHLSIPFAKFCNQRKSFIAYFCPFLRIWLIFARNYECDEQKRLHFSRVQLPFGRQLLQPAITQKIQWRSENHRQSGGFTPSETPAGRRRFEAQKGSFELCGARLKELFEKSSLRNLKNFLAFIKIENFRAVGSEIHLQLATSN